MEENLAKTAGVGVTINIGGKEYAIKPLSVNDLAELEGYLRSKKLREFLAAIKDQEIPTAEKLEIIRDLSGGSVDSLEVGQFMSSMEGVRFLFHRIMLKTDPTITLEKVGELVTTNNLEEVTEIIESVGAKEEENPPAEKGKTDSE